MTVIVNCRFLTQDLTGVQRFAEEITKRLPGLIDDDVELVAPSGELRHRTLGGVRVRQIGKLHGHAWEQLELARYVNQRGALLVSLANTGPVLVKNQLLVVHDITWAHFPASYSWQFRTAYRILTASLVRRVRQLVTVSDFSKRDIAQYFRIDQQSIAVVNNAVDDRFRTEAGRRPKYAPDDDYFLVVSSLNEHKNVGPFIKAYQQYRNVSKTTTNLVLVGGSSRVFSRRGGPEATSIGDITTDGVVALGRVNDDELIWLYRHARAFFFPSLYEGFGIPPLEAVACGCPTFSSNAASLPEVLGDRAQYFSPTSAQSMISALRLADVPRGKTVERISKGGIATWDQSAEILWSSMRGQRTGVRQKEECAVEERLVDTSEDGRALRILRISHSDVVPEWRGRQRQLIKRGASIRTITARHWREGGKEVQASHQVAPGEGELLPIPTLGQHPILFLYSPRRLWKALRGNWDVVDIHEEPYSLAAAEIRILLMLAGIHAPTVVYSAQNIERDLPFVFRVIEGWQIRSTSVFSVCNTEAKLRLVKRGAKDSQVHVIGLGYSEDRFHPSEKAVRATEIGYVGRLQRHAKGIEVLIDAFSDSRISDEVTLHFYGGGDDEEYLRQLARQSPQGERIIFHGAVPNEDIPDVYARLAVAVVPSIDTDTWKEQFGRSAVEAIACGVPTVVSDTEALQEVCGDLAIVVPQNDPSALADAIVRSLVLPRDQYVQTVRERYGWSAVGDRYASLYASVTLH